MTDGTDAADLADLAQTARAAVKLADVIATDSEKKEAREALKAARKFQQAVADLVAADLIDRGAAMRRRHMQAGRPEHAERVTEATVDAIRTLREESK